MKVQLSAIVVHQIWEEQEWTGGKSQLTCIYSPLGRIASHNYWETVYKWQICECLQGSETCWFLPLAKDPLSFQAWGPLTCLLSSLWGLSSVCLVSSLAISCCPQGLPCLVSTLMKSPSILHPSLKTKTDSLERGPS